MGKKYYRMRALYIPSLWSEQAFKYSYNLTHISAISFRCRLLVEALMMTGSDLCANSKPWDLQMQTVNVIYEEFYKQVGLGIKKFFANEIIILSEEQL